MLNLLSSITAGNAIFLAFLVMTVRRDANTTANRWLGAFMCLLGLFLLEDSFYVYGIYQRHPGLIGLLSLPAFALAPALYCSVSQFVAVEKRGWRPKDLWHFVPFFIFVLLSTPFLLASDEIKLKELVAKPEPMQLEGKIILGLLLFQIILYWFFSLRKLLKHRKNLENITASPGEIQLDWLLYFLYAIAGLVMIWLFELFLVPFDENASWYTPAYFIGINCLGYFALRQKEVFPFTQKEAEEVSEILAEDETLPPGGRRLLFAASDIAHLKQQLIDKMETQKPYLDPELSLPGLARQMGLSVHEMSELVNEGFGENFAQFVNRYRVEESKRLLLSNKYAHLNMVGIAYEAGFNSKTAFNTAFKKMAGVSPTAFRSAVAASDFL